MGNTSRKKQVNKDIFVCFHGSLRFAAFVYAGTNMGTVISMPVSGYLCDVGDGLLFNNVHNFYVQYLGWESVFYVFGALGVVWFIAWIILTSDGPDNHPR